MSKGRKIAPIILILFTTIAMVVGFFVGGEAISAIYINEFRQYVASGAAHAKLLPPNVVYKGIESSRSNAIVRATRKTAPSTVGIVVTQIQMVRHPYADENFFDFFFNPDLRPPRYRKIENIGSGFIISEDGMILTNYHVVRNATRLYVNFPDGNQIEGQIVGVDEKSDLAVISAPGHKFKTAQFGNSSECMIGEWVIALGNPFLDFMNDAHPTVTVGVISALNRNFAPAAGVYYRNMIQTDASINLGNSGGPLVNALGEVIGVNSFIYTGSGAHTGSIGIGFAIPINRARRVADELIAHGQRRQVWTGLAVRDINNTSMAAALNNDGMDGVAIISIRPQSPADVAGLRVSDIIHRVDDRVIHSSTDLDGFFLDYFVGDSINVRYSRAGKQMMVWLVLQEWRG